MTSGIMRPVRDDEPLMIAWKAYQSTDDFANTKKWAAYPEHLQGSLWAAFMAGYLAMQAASPVSDDAVERVFKVLRNWRLSTITQEDEPSEGYPLVDAVSTPGGVIASGEEELGEIAAEIVAALSIVERAEPTCSCAWGAQGAPVDADCPLHGLSDEPAEPVVEPSATVDDLKTKLVAVERTRFGPVPCNPDGPEALARIEALEAGLREVLPYLEEGYLEDEPDDEPIGWCSDSDGTNQRPLKLTFGMVRRVRALLNSNPGEGKDG